jgi:non-specific serine/threonine protein kinase/serine/threonine-protein kinase
VEQFAEDLRRHLEGLPVIARRDTLGYRTTKFIGRHKVAVTAGVMSVLSLVAGTVVAVWQAQRAQVERTRAERRFGDVRRLAHSFLFEIHDSIQDLAGSTRARELLVRRGLEYLDGLAQEATGDEALQAELAAAYVKVGDVQGRPGYANLGDRKGALASYRKAAALYQEVASRRPKDPGAQQDLASTQDRLGDTLRTAGDSEQALSSYRSALALRTRLLEGDTQGL